MRLRLFYNLLNMKKIYSKCTEQRNVISTQHVLCRLVSKEKQYLLQNLDYF
jgi:hypothetical protein